MSNSGQLTPRQTQIISLTAEGLSAKMIGDRIGISKGTVNTHQRNAYKRLGASNAAHCVAIILKAPKPQCERRPLPCDL